MDNDSAGYKSTYVYYFNGRKMGALIMYLIPAVKVCSIYKKTKIIITLIIIV